VADITDLLNRWTEGETGSFGELVSVVYSEMRAIAHSLMRHERPGHLLGTTALVHEAYLRLVDQNRISWQGRAHFFGAVARAMRRILVDDARKRLAARRGAGSVAVGLDTALPVSAEPDLDVVALSAALDELEQMDPERARVVELRYFAGLTLDETAEILGCSPQAVSRDWTVARAWLARRLHNSGGEGVSGMRQEPM
jgi:RNA polymerase sigma factor (TIGR02999 family)